MNKIFYHEKYKYVKEMIKNNIPLLLTGQAGSGKTTMLKQIADDLNKPFYSISLTKQTSVNAIIGFNSINGTYIPSQFRYAYENGGIFLLDELDASDPNVLLSLNTIENGYVAFPDGIIEGHKDFRLVATANPQEEHSIYTGRSKLDFSTLDRYYTINIERDSNLEEQLTSKEIVKEITIARKILKDHGSTKQVTMRDAIRVYKLTKIGLDKNPIEQVIFNNDKSLLSIYKEEYNKIKEELRILEEEKRKKEEEERKTQKDVDNLDDFWKKIQENK